MNKEAIKQINALIAEAGSIQSDEARVEFCCKAVPLLAMIGNNVERECLIARAAEAIGITRDSLTAEVTRERGRGIGRQHQPSRTIVDALDNLDATLNEISICMNEIIGALQELTEKKTAQGATNTQDGKAEQISTGSVSYDTKETEELQV